MSRTIATDYISLGVVARTFPLDKIHAALETTGKESVRQRICPLT